MNREQVEAVAEQLTAVAAVFNPAAAASLTGLIAAGKAFSDLLVAVKANDPELWEKVSADFTASLAAFDASEPKEH